MRKSIYGAYAVKVKKTDVLYIMVSLFTLFFCLFGLSGSYKVYEYIGLVTYAVLLTATLQYRNFSLYQVFLSTYFIFLMSRVFLDAVGLYNLQAFDMFRFFDIQEDDLCMTLRTVIVFLIGSSYAWIISNKEAGMQYFESGINKIQVLNKLLKVLFYIYFAIFLAKLLYIAKFVAARGYLSLFTGEFSEDKLPLIFTGSGTMTEILFALLIFYNRDRKSFIHYSIFYLTVSGFRIFTGQRAMSMLMFLFVICIYSTYYREQKIISAKAIGSVAALSVLVELMAQFRNGTGLDPESMLNENFLYLMLTNLGISINVVTGTILFRSSMTNKYPFILSYFTDIFDRTGGQTAERISGGNYLGDHLTYQLSNIAYLSGRGTGTSIVAEVYDLCSGNLFLILCVSFILTMIVLAVCNKAYRSAYRFVISYFLAIDFIFSPRWSIFKSVKTVIFALLLVYVITAFENKVYCGSNDKTVLSER